MFFATTLAGSTELSILVKLLLAALAGAINRAFAMDLAPGEAFCILPGTYVPLFCLSTVALAGLASLVAAWRATCIEPAEVIREQ